MVPTANPEATFGDLTLLRENVGFLLQLAHRRMQRELNRELFSLELEARHLAVLAVIRDHPRLTQRSLVDCLEIDKSSAVYIVDDLEKLGLARREPDPKDRRSNAIQITANGRKRLAEGLKIAHRLQSRAVTSFTNTDINVLRELLNRLIENLPTGAPLREAGRER